MVCSDPAVVRRRNDLEVAAVASVRVNFAVGPLAPSDIGILGRGFAGKLWI